MAGTQPAGVVPLHLQLFGQGGPPALRDARGRVVESIRRAAQTVGIGMVGTQPAGVVPLHLVAMADAEPHMFEAVVGERQRMVGIACPERPDLMAIGGPGSLIATGAAEGARRHRPRAARVSGGSGNIGDVLVMGLAHQPGPPARGAQDIGECRAVQRHRDAVLPAAVHGRYLPRRHAGPVRLADRVGDVETLNPYPLGGDGVEVGRPHHPVAVGAKVVPALLVRHDDQEVRSALRACGVVHRRLLQRRLRPVRES
jgi:hypothetical protein